MDRITRATEPVIRAAVEGSRIVISHADPADDDGGGSGRARGGSPALRHPATGCRADTLMGAWLYPAEYFEPLLSAAWQIVESGEILLYADRSERMRAERDAGDLVEVDGDGIAHVSISGPLTKHETSLSSVVGGTSYTRIRDQMREARDQHAAGKIKGVFVDMESAGGTAEGAAETAAAIARTAKVMPVAVHTEDKAMSGALWLGTQGTRFTAGRGAMVGSQGAVLYLVDRSENFKRQGLRPVVISTGPDKAIGAPGVEISEEDRATLQRRIEAQNKPFFDDVRDARSLSKAQAEEVAKASVFIGADAERVGLVDRICTREEALAELRHTIKSGGGNGGATSHAQGAAASGDSTMPAAVFTAGLLTRVHALSFPNCKAATEADAPEVLTAAAEHAAGEISKREADLVKVTGERDAALKQITKLPEGEILKARASAGRARVENLKLKGTLSPAMEQRLQTMIGEAGKENAELFAGSEGATVLDRVLDVFNEAPRQAPPTGVAAPAQGGAGVSGEQPGNSAGQGVYPVADPRLNPQGADPAAAGVAQGEQYAAEMLRQKGIVK